MPNFNTSTMKVAIYPVKDDNEQHPLPTESIKKLKALIVYCIEREQDLTVVVSFNEHYLCDTAVKEVAQVLKSKNAKVHMDELGLLIFFTEEGKMITVKFEGGAGQFLRYTAKRADRRTMVKKPKMKHIDEDEEIEDASGMGLTQECNF